MNYKNLTLPIAIVIGGLVIAGAVIYTQAPCRTEGEILPQEEVSESILDYVNNNLLRGAVQASVVEVAEENGLYKVTIEVQGQQVDTYAIKNGELFFPDGINLSQVAPVAVSEGQTIGNFNVSGDEICREDGKPIVYFFGSESCSHCQWEHPIFQEVAASFGEEVSFRDNMGTEDDRDILQKYSTGGVPALVLGCRYYRVGSGEQEGEELEKDNLTALFCKLTDSKPAEVCDQVTELIEQI